jgi:nucleoside-diphosphate-sugar epimerase
MIIALSGGSGFIGSRVIELAARDGHTIRALYRKPNPPLCLTGKITWIRGDMTSFNVWDELLAGSDAIIHLAASGVANLNNAFDAVHTNLPALAHLLRSAARHGVKRLVTAGSCFEYGRTGEVIGQRGLVETDPLDPVNSYAATKAAATLLMRPLARDLGLQCFILRPFHTYGPKENPARLIPSVIRASLTGHPIRTTDGRQIRDLVHVDDVAEAFLRAATVDWVQQEPGACVLNLCSDRPHQLRAVIESVVRACGRDPALVEFGAVVHRPHEMWRLVGDSSAAARFLDWRIKIDLQEGLSRMIKVMRQEGGLT